uniref:LD-carboxypeptidase n=1 Tax=Desulfobacca acetoxidans TaxID=60893 RepID=A0A7C3UXL4_9BACT
MTISETRQQKVRLPGQRPVWPPPLAPGDTVAAVAPASPISREAWEAGLKIVESWGFRVVFSPEIFTARSWGQAADRQAARRFQEIWENPEAKAVIAVRGGYGSLKILPYLDLNRLARHPKRLVGFSDLTNLLLTLHQRLGWVTFHGPTLAHLAEVTPAARESWRHWLAAPGPEKFALSGLSVLHSGQAAGPLSGGNLTTLCHLLGTPYAPRFAGSLLFLEDHNEALYRLDRLAHHLLFSGALDGVQGILLGSFTGGASQAHAEEVLALAFKPLGVPVAAGLPVGHQPENHTLPLGARARLDTAAATLVFG